MKSKLWIHWIGVGEYDEGEETLQETIEYIKCGNRWDNYGRCGAEIIEGKTLYSISHGIDERFGDE